MPTPTLAPRGHLIIGPTQHWYAPVVPAEELESNILGAKEECLYQENRRKREGDPDWTTDEELRVVELFSKDWCGPTDLSAEGVESLEDWDVAFARLQSSTPTK